MKVIQCEKSDRLLDGYSMVQPAVAGERGVGYFPLTASAKELEQGSFTRLSADEYSLPKGCKHGSVIPVTKQEYERLED